MRKECNHLAFTDQRLFGGLFALDQDAELAERVETFIGRFGRLQDTMGDKLLSMLLLAMGEKASAAVDNLDRAERLALVDSADHWMTVRKLRNQIIHEYVEDPVILISALQSGHPFVPVLVATASKMIAEIERRGWA